MENFRTAKFAQVLTNKVEINITSDVAGEEVLVRFCPVNETVIRVIIHCMSILHVDSNPFFNI